MSEAFFGAYRRTLAVYQEGVVTIAYTKLKGQGMPAMFEKTEDPTVTLGDTYGLALVKIEAGTPVPPIEEIDPPEVPPGSVEHPIVLPGEPDQGLPAEPGAPSHPIYLPGYPGQLPVYPGGPAQLPVFPSYPGQLPIYPGGPAQLPVFPGYPSQPIYLPGYPGQLPVFPGKPEQGLPGTPDQGLPEVDAPEVQPL